MFDFYCVDEFKWGISIVCSGFPFSIGFVSLTSLRLHSDAAIFFKGGYL
jgi:hypothetical protein